MKLKTEQEVETLGYKIQGHPVTNHAFIQGYMQAQQDLLASASEGFEEYIDYMTSGGNYQVNRLDLHEQTWQAAKLSQAKEISDLREEINFLKAANAKLEEARVNHLEENENLQKENEELKKQVELAKNQEYHALTNPWRIKYGEVKSENEELKKENEELKQELLLSKPLYSRRKLEERIKEAEEIIVSWNEYLKRENGLASKIGTVADDYIAKWNLLENTDSSKEEVK